MAKFTGTWMSSRRPSPQGIRYINTSISGLGALSSSTTTSTNAVMIEEIPHVHDIIIIGAGPCKISPFLQTKNLADHPSINRWPLACSSSPRIYPLSTLYRLRTPTVPLDALLSHLPPNLQTSESQSTV